MVFGLVAALPVAARDLTLLMSEKMIASGFDKQILPRFKFKHRIVVQPVTSGAADMVFGNSGKPVFQIIDGEAVRLDIQTDDPGAVLFLDWLRSPPGRAAVESFQPDGSPIYTGEIAPVKIEVAETFDGDVDEGSRLALQHCGRCHVVDERNRMGGIGSTPSFGAMRGRENWASLFLAFYYENPHPSFTQVEGVTEPFDENRQIHVAPVYVTLEEIDSIVAFIATMEPKSLGRPIQPN